MNKLMLKENIKIEEMIFEVRGKQVILSSDVAKLYKTETRIINQMIKRNIMRFLETFCFQLTAEDHQIMTMKDWINVTDELLKFRKKSILSDSGKISHNEVIKKAENEYEKFRIKQDREYISSMDEMYKRYIEENKKY